VNDPDVVLFVGEALVGNEAVDQLVKFNQALADYSATDNPHLIDGIVLTKFDTIDDKVGPFVFRTNIFACALSMLLFFASGWRCHFHDLYHWPTDCFCGHRSNLH